MSNTFTASSFENFMDEDIQFFLIRENGREEQLELTSLPASNLPSVRITEQEKISFVLRSKNEIEVDLDIQDLNLLRPYKYLTDICIEYRWRPSQDEPGWFLNHFGYSNLEIRMVSTQQEYRQYATVEVFATKFNADRAEEILDYLESRLDDVTRTCFNATYKRASTTHEGETSVSILLQTIEDHLKATATLLPYFRDRKRKRLIPTLNQIKATSATNLTEHSVGWILSHLDTLMPATCASPSSINIGGRFYEPDQIETSELVEHTDVYENRVIAGYLESIANRLSEIERFYSEQLDKVSKEGFVAEIPLGFKSIFEIKRKFGMTHYGKLLRICHLLQNTCADQIAYLQKHIPVCLPVKAMPKLTPGFLASPHYYRTFQKIVDWYKIGRLNLSGERYLYGLRTLDKLYEFYCLFRQIETLEQLGWRIIRQEAGTQPLRRQASPEWSANPDSTYVFEKAKTQGDRLSLYYEPLIERTTNSQLNLIRTSAGGDALEPDFVIEFQPVNDTPASYAVLDAKYTTPANALYIGTKRRYEDELTKTTMKYFHGLGIRGGGSSPVRATFVLHPKRFDDTSESTAYRSYHAKPFDMFSSQRVFPILGAIEVSPEKSAIIANTAISNKLIDVFSKMIEILQVQS